MPKLIIFDDRVRGIDLPEVPVILGRSRKADIPIRDPILSRKHCAILPQGEGTFRLVDLKSSHGTYLDGKRVQRVKLEDRALLEIGTTVLIFSEGETPGIAHDPARARNPDKARALLEQLGPGADGGDAIRIERFRGPRTSSKRRRSLIESLPDLREAPLERGGRLEIEDELLELLVDYSMHRTTSLLIQRRAHLKKAISRTVEESLVEILAGNWETLRPRLKEKLRASLRLPAEVPASSGPPSGEEEGRRE